jgi:hypothetical protein
MPKLVVIGGGNSTPIFATLAKTAGWHVTVLTRKPDQWSLDIGFINEDSGYIKETELYATIDNVTADPASCIPDADMIFIAGLPIHLNPVVLANIRPHINRENANLKIGSICAYGGFNWVCAQSLGAGKYHIFGVQTIPWCCGTKQYGKLGVVFGAKRFCRVATEDGKDGIGIKSDMSKILQMPCEDSDFLACTLWPNNPWIHPPILYGLFKDWDGKSSFAEKGFGKVVPSAIYADLRQPSIDCLEVLNKELVALVAELAKLYPDDAHMQMNYDLAYCICDNYKDLVTDQTNMGTVFMTCKAYASHHIPYTTVEGGIVPTLAHKFFETDLPFGLCTYKDMALMVGVDTPCMDAIILWNQKLINKEYLNEATGKMDGRDAGECVLASALGLSKDNLLRGCRE